MLKQWFLLLALSLAGQTLFAQQLNTGIRVGTNLSNISDDDINDPKTAVLLDIAIPIEIGLTENFSIQPEVHLIEKGHATEIGALKTRSVRSYLEFPLLAKYTFHTDAIGFYLAAGPTFGFALGQRGVTINTNSDIRVTTQAPFNDNQVTFDFGMSLGAGLALPFNSGELLLDVRYLHDFNDNFDLNDPLGIIDENYFRSVAITLGYAFSL